MEHSRLSLARRLKLQQIAIFEKVVECGSILAASRELHMTQPAVSKSIQELEAQFGEALFTRSKRGVSLTEFGVLLERHAQTLSAELRLLADDVNAWSNGASGQVVIGTLLSASARLLPQALALLLKTAPKVSVKIRVGSNDVLFPELRRGHLDVVVGLLPQGHLPAGLTHVPLYTEALCAVAASNHPLAGLPAVAGPQLREYPWIIPAPESDVKGSVQLFFDALGVGMPHQVIESVCFLTNMALLVESRAIALVPRLVAEQFARGGAITILSLDMANAPGSVGYTVCTDRQSTAATQRLLRAFRQVAQEWKEKESAAA